MKYSIFLLFLMSAVHIFAQEWTGAVSSDWNDPSNWSSAPSNGDNILIDPANYSGAMADPVIAANSAFTPAEVLVQGGAHLTIQANLSASDRVEILGAGTIVTISSGAFSVNGPGNNARLIFAEDAHLQMEGGTLIAGQRLLFELGGTGEINGGTVTVGETLALVDGGLTGSSTLVQNGGTITVDAELGFENEAGVFYPLFLQTGGELNVNGSLLWLGAAPGAGRGYFRATGGETTVTGTIGNDPASTMGMHIELTGNALFANQGAAVTLLAGDSLVMTGDAVWNDQAGATWQNAGVFYAEGSLFEAAGSQFFGTGSYQFANLTLNSQTTYHTPAEMFVSGNLYYAGALELLTNRIVFNGTEQQEVIGEFTVYDMTVNNPAGILSETIGITHELDLTQGIVAIPLAANYVFFEDGATVVNASAVSFVDGRVSKYGDDAFEFPVGESPDRYRPVSMSAPAPGPAVETRLIRAEYIYAPHDPLVPFETPLQAVSAVEYWNMEQLAGPASPVSATLGWNDAAQSGLTDCADLSMTVWDGAQWVFVPSVTSGQCDGNNAGSLSSTTELPVLGPLTIGFTDSVTQQAVHLCPGETFAVGANIYDSAGVYIDVLQDMNGNDSTVVTSLAYYPSPEVSVLSTAVAIYSGASSGWQWVDCNNNYAPIPGATEGVFYPAENGSYAVIVTQNGCSDTSECVIIDELGLSEYGADATIVWPNPVKAGSWLNVRSGSDILAIRLFSTDGREVVAPQVKADGEKTQVLIEGLAAGSYQLVIVSADGSVAVQRLVVE